MYSRSTAIQNDTNKAQLYKFVTKNSISLLTYWIQNQWQNLSYYADAGTVCLLLHFTGKQITDVIICFLLLICIETKSTGMNARGLMHALSKHYAKCMYAWCRVYQIKSTSPWPNNKQWYWFFSGENRTSQVSLTSCQTLLYTVTIHDLGNVVIPHSKMTR